MKVMFIILFLTFAVFGQQKAKVTGTLKEGNQPVSSTKVKLVSATESFETTTDAEGRFSFENVSDGSYLLIYGNNRTLVTVINGEAFISNSTNVVLISVNNLQPIEEVSKTVDVIDFGQIQERNDFSLAESLRTIPGFRIQQLGGFGRLASIKTRGLRNQDTAVLIDGVRFRDVASISGDATAFLSDFTLTGISRVEILRGPGSSLYGTNAIGGTIDLQTPTPEAGMKGEIGGLFGGYGLGRFYSKFSDGTRDKKFAYGLSISRTAYTKGIDEQDNAHNANFQARIEFNPSRSTNISGRFFISDAYVRLNSSPDTIGTLPPTNSVIIKAIPLSRSELKRYENGTPVSQLNRGNATFIPDANDPDSTQKSKFFNGQVVLTQVFRNDLILRAFYSGLKTSRKNQNGTLGVGFQSASTSIFDGTVQSINTRLDWIPNRIHEITLGYEFEHEKYGNDGFTPTGTGNFFTRAYQSSNSFFAQDVIRLLEGKLILSGGFRIQTFNLDTPKFSLTNAPYQTLSLEDPPTAYTFDGAGSYFITQTRTKLRVHIGKGYRVPSLYERFGSFFNSFSRSFVALGDPNLEPERTIGGDAGIEQYLFGDNLKLSAVYFYTKLIRTIGFGSPVSNIGTTPRPFGGYFNTQGGISRGSEFVAEAKIAKITSIFASYTYINSDQRQPQVAGSGIIETLAVPKHQFTLVTTQKIKNLWVNFDFLATSSYLAPIFSNSVFRNYIYRFDGNRKADLTIGYQVPLKKENLRLKIFGTIENLLDDEYYENGFRTFERYGRIGLSFSF
jgi:outer membrane receptor protein involved in Fe transport